MKGRITQDNNNQMVDSMKKDMQLRIKPSLIQKQQSLDIKVEMFQNSG